MSTEDLVQLTARMNTLFFGVPKSDTIGAQTADHPGNRCSESLLLVRTYPDQIPITTLGIFGHGEIFCSPIGALPDATSAQ